ncbi:MAG: YihA family ribosome biogenesis GTP-binding protein [Candidatus Zixiibacteriota bacterium]|nr:MAG: YihA family ribosome biogenesis GTP-binding protein [candidate division Zixibacteria bacterium]
MESAHSCVNEANYWKKSGIAKLSLEVSFVGSFFALDQLPSDRRPQVAVAGRSNVGKSSLLNRIVGRKKIAKVSKTPGRTRSLNFFLVSDRFHLVDLPGYGYAKVSKSLRASWGKLIEEYLVNCDDLVGLVLLLDCRREPTEEDWQLIRWLAERELPVLVAITKADKLNRDKLNKKVRKIESELGVAAIPFSAMTGIGKNELISAVNSLVDDNLQQAKAKPNG